MKELLRKAFEAGCEDERIPTEFEQWYEELKHPVKELEEEVIRLKGFNNMFNTPDSVRAALNYALEMDTNNNMGPISQTPLYMLVNYLLKE